jgi:hypothetical protein
LTEYGVYLFFVEFDVLLGEVLADSIDVDSIDGLIDLFDRGIRLLSFFGGVLED